MLNMLEAMFERVMNSSFKSTLPQDVEEIRPEH